MGERGIDVSEWQAGMDTERVSRDNGLTFAMVRTNYGSNHDDLQFHKLCDGFEKAGVIVTPYSYPLETDTRGSIDDAVRIIGGRYDRLDVDWEVGSGGGDHLRAAHERVWEHGLKTPLVYDPAWYYQQVGSPNVDWMGQSGRIAGRWKSWYPDNVPGSFDAVLAKLPASVWNDNRGGIPTQIVQFSSSVRFVGWDKNTDANYFRGTHEQLVALLTGEEDMISKEEFFTWMTEWHIYRSRPKGGQPTWEDGPTVPETLAMIQTKVDATFAELSDDETKILTALRALGGSLTPEQQAELIKGQLNESVWLALAKLARGDQNPPV
jgi:hypothetical protein